MDNNKFKNAVLIANNVYWVGEFLEDDVFESHSYLIVNGDESILIDPGSMLEFESIKRKIESIIPFKNIKYLVAHHQDPDVCANIPAFEKLINRDDLKIVSHSRNLDLIKHYGVRSKYFIIDQNNFTLNTKNLSLEFLTTPYAHAPGAFVTYLKNEKILFSSDIFGAIEKNWQFYADKDYFTKIKSFHDEYMPSKDILNYSLEKIEKLDLTLIAPQHGSIIKKEFIKPIIDELKELDCGLYIQNSYKNTLIYKNKLLKEEEKKKYRLANKLQTIMDLQDNIIAITTDGKDLKYISKAFFNFSNFKDFEDFKKSHNCICELFLDFEGDKYLKPKYNKENYNWISHLKESKNKQHYAIMKNKNGENTLFNVILKEFNLDDEDDEYLVLFHDVTPYMESTDIINMLTKIDGVYISISNLKGEILKISDSLLNILEVNDFVPKKYKISDFLNEKDTKKAMEHIANNDSSAYEIKIRKNGIKIPALVQGSFGLLNQEPVRIAVLLDLREIKKLQDEAKKKDLILFQQARLAQMGEMINMIAHQWRQPLNSISAVSIKLNMKKELGILSDDEFKQSNEFIQDQCQKMSKVIDTFMNYSNAKTINEEFFIKDVIGNILELVSTQFANHNIKLNIEYSDENAKLNGDKNMLEQVLLNLLMNARDALDENKIENKEVTIKIFNDKIEVIDNAGGVKDKNIDKLFTPYFTTKPQGKGTGLGLYMSKRIMNEQFGGELLYEKIENRSIFRLDFK